MGQWRKGRKPIHRREMKNCADPLDNTVPTVYTVHTQIGDEVMV